MSPNSQAQLQGQPRPSSDWQNENARGVVSLQDAVLVSSKKIIKETRFLSTYEL